MAFLNFSGAVFDFFISVDKNKLKLILAKTTGKTINIRGYDRITEFQFGFPSFSILFAKIKPPFF
ncbi:MAG: hypothetical protein ACI81W_004066 [Saprospiraceae bacterium]|jgi:hypothetical protein